MEAKLIEQIAFNDEFQAACQHYAHGNGSSMAIAGAALRALGVPGCRGTTEKEHCSG